MIKPVILVVDDEYNTRNGIKQALDIEDKYEVETAESTDAALAVLERRPVDLMLSDIRMPGRDGISLVSEVVKRFPHTLCILLTAYGSIETAVDAMRSGAYDFLTKPINLDHLDVKIQQALEAQHLKSRVENLQSQVDQKYGMGNIIGESESMQKVYTTIRDAAPTDATVLIQGASGTGKELAAHAIHQLSNRSQGPFIAVNCSALASTILESELFGHEKGAFTGATTLRKGRFELANGGTLFLDEISEIDQSVQVKLLRVLQEREIERVGGTQPIKVDFRLIVATNRKLADCVKKGTFREDLFYRLNVLCISLPSLCDRVGDIPLLLHHFLKEFNKKNGKQIQGFTPEALNLLSSYKWPGNVRELRNVVERMVVLSHHQILDETDVPPEITRGIVVTAQPIVAAPTPAVQTTGEKSVQTTPAVPAQPVASNSLGEGSLADTERCKIMAVLKENGGNKTRAAEELGISRRTLHRKLRAYREAGMEDNQ